MQLTKLLYLESFNAVSCDAKVISVDQIDGRTDIVLDRTVFYPQGGGQPYDHGTITSEDAVYLVEEVRFIEGLVHHYGQFDHGTFTVGQKVLCEVDEVRRSLHTRLHSAGHIVDMALKRLGIDWTPGKGYHFPEGPYVEYAGDLGNMDRDKLRANIETACNEVISEDLPTKLEFVSLEAAEKQGLEVAPQIAASGKPIRIVSYGDFGILCGGTHVSHLGEVGKISIKKIRPEKEQIRVAYNLI